MRIDSRLEEFAGRFVIPTFRERFVHEAMKKPQKLHERICHRIEDVFSIQFKNGRLPFCSGDLIYPIIGTGVEGQGDCDWDTVSNCEGSGYGFLVASADLQHFYAETESGIGFPYLIYSSGI